MKKQLPTLIIALTPFLTTCAAMDKEMPAYIRITNNGHESVYICPIIAAGRESLKITQRPIELEPTACKQFSLRCAGKQLLSFTTKTGQRIHLSVFFASQKETYELKQKRARDDTFLWMLQ